MALLCDEAEALQGSAPIIREVTERLIVFKATLAAAPA